MAPDPTDCVFCRIVAGEIPATVVRETDDVVVIEDASPKAPVHLLVIPRDHTRDLPELASTRPEQLAHLVETAKAAVAAAGHTDFRLVVNTGAGAGQSVFHTHAHVLAGEGEWKEGL